MQIIRHKPCMIFDDLTMFCNWWDETFICLSCKHSKTFEHGLHHWQAYRIHEHKIYALWLFLSFLYSQHLMEDLVSALATKLQNRVYSCFKSTNGKSISSPPTMYCMVQQWIILWTKDTTASSYWGIMSSYNNVPRPSISSLRLSDKYMHNWTGPSLVQVMAWRRQAITWTNDYVNQCWNVVNLTLREKTNINQNSYIFI